MAIGLAFGIEDSDDEYLGYCPEEHWWSAESLDAFLNQQPIDPWNFAASVSDEGVADLATRYESNLEKMIEMMRSPQNWREDFDPFYESESKKYHQRIGMNGIGVSWIEKIRTKAECWLTGISWFK